MSLLQNKIKIINFLLESQRKIRKEKKKIRGRILLNKQLIEEVKRGKQESHLIHKEKIEDIESAVEKKSILRVQFVKKFEEVEIYIRRECQNFPKYKDVYINFKMELFLSKNDDLMLQKEETKKKLDLIELRIKLIKEENREMKSRIREIKIDNDNKNSINSITTSKLKNTILDPNIKDLSLLNSVQKDKINSLGEYYLYLKNFYSQCKFNYKLRLTKIDDYFEDIKENNNDNFNELNDMSQMLSEDYYIKDDFGSESLFQSNFASMVSYGGISSNVKNKMNCEIELSQIKRIQN